MSQTYIGIAVMLLSVFLPRLGVVIDNDSLTAFISTGFVIVGGLWAFWGRYRLGGVTVAGFRK